MTRSSVHDFDKAETVAAARAQRDRTVALLEDLSPDQWEVEVVPRWRVREVAAHLVSTDEAALTGRLLALGFSRREVEDVEAWNDEQVRRWADRPIAALLWGLERWGRRMTSLVSALPAPVASRRLPTPFGAVSALWLTMLRVYDEWVHLEDVRRAFGRPSDDSAEALTPVARMLLAGIPIQTLPRLGGGASGRVELAFDDVPVEPVGFDLGARRFGRAVRDTEARVCGRAGALVMVAARRDVWRDAERDGLIRIEGERAPAETFLDALLLV